MRTLGTWGCLLIELYYVIRGVYQFFPTETEWLSHWNGFRGPIWLQIKSTLSTKTILDKSNYVFMINTLRIILTYQYHAISCYCTAGISVLLINYPAAFRFAPINKGTTPTKHQQHQILTWWSASGQLAVQPCCSWSSSMITTSFPVPQRSSDPAIRQFPDKTEVVSIGPSGFRRPTRSTTSCLLVCPTYSLSTYVVLKQLINFFN